MYLKIIPETKEEAEHLESCHPLFSLAYHEDGSQIVGIFDGDYVRFLGSQSEEDSSENIATIVSIVANSMSSHAANQGSSNKEQLMARAAELIPEKFAVMPDPKNHF